MVRWQHTLQLTLVLAVLGLLASPAPVWAQSASHYFLETGFTVRGLFWQYWQTHGGLAQQGYPISEEFPERSTDGKIYTVQYFERAVFEYHPENAAPHNVLLKLLGREAYDESFGQEGATNQQPITRNGRYFSETGHWLGGVFRDYWEANGGLEQQGYPVSDVFWGGDRWIQYFERAVFEYHPENRPPYNVLLRRLGAERHDRFLVFGRGGGCPACPPEPTPTPKPVLPCALPHAISGYADPQTVSPGPGYEALVEVHADGFSEGDQVDMELVAPNGGIVTIVPVIGVDGQVGGDVPVTREFAPGVWTVGMSGVVSRHQALVYFCVR